MTRYPKYQRKMNIFDSLAAAITDPYGTMNHLLNERTPPPYIILVVVFVAGILVGPVIAHQYQYDLQLPQKEFTYSWVLSLALGWLFFVLLTTVFLRLIGVAAPLLKVIACSVYALTPIFPFTLAYYLGNYKTIGKLTVITYLITGSRAHDDWFLSLLPYFVNVTALFCFIVFSQGLRAIGKMSLLGSLVCAGVAMVILVLALFIGVTVSGAIFPDTMHLVWKFFRHFGTPPEMH